MKYYLDEKILKIEISSIFNDTIQSFFDEFIPSKKIQHLLIQNKWIKMDGNPVKREDDIVGMYLEINIYPNDYEYIKTDSKIEIVYEDELLVIVNKPKGVLVHSDGNEDNTLTKWLESYYADRSYINVQALHRLDTDTCGLVMFSKSEIFQPLLDKLLSEKQIRRSYMAFVKGKLEKNNTLSINKAIGKDRHDSSRRVIYKGGQEAFTKVRSLGYSKVNDVSIVRCTLETGRTHQIRVHLASEHLPILNDPLYGIPSSLIIRMGLIADELEFYHPLKQEVLNIEVNLPNDLSNLYMKVIK